MTTRENTKRIWIGPVPIGAGAPVAVQSMTTTHPQDIEGTLREIEEARRAGCEIMRVAVPDEEAARAFGELKRQSPLPLIADIHFRWKVAFEVIEAGADGVRINPGTLSQKALREVISAAREASIPIRVGINAASLPRRIRERFGGATPEAMVEAALEAIKLSEDLGHAQIKVSLKASDVLRTVEAYRLFAQRSSYPLHLGITEAGPPFSGAVKSAVGLGILLAEGLGDTLRVSLTGSPVLEVRAAYHILGALGIRERGVDIISCPTCGRCEVDLVKLVEEVQGRLLHITAPIKVAVMGCVVNGPGEAKEADVGIAGGRGEGVLFRKGEVIARLPEREWVPRLVEEVQRLAQQYATSGGCKGSSESPSHGSAP